MTKSRDAGQDLVRRFGPHEGRGVCVGEVDVLANGVLELPRAAVNTPADLFLSQHGEPPLHEIDPGRPRRGEVHVEARMADQPPVDRRRLWVL